jgi:hypothetical protein
VETLADAIAQFQGAEAGGFDLSEEQTVSLLNEGVKRFASVSEWIRAELELGPTIASQEEYNLPGNVVKLLRVAVAGYPFERHDLQTLWDLKLGRLGLARPNEGGVFAERFGEDGIEKKFSLWLPPTDAGQPITGLAAITPDDLKPADVLPFPPEYRRGPLDFAKGIAYEEIDENPQSGSYFLDRANARALELRGLTNSRTGAGPVKARVAGHAR